MLSLNEIKRYSRQLILPNFGVKEQRKLRMAKVVVTGAGGIGCPALVYLAEAGVGRITIIDQDKVEASNFNRQFLFKPADIGKPKAKVAEKRLRELNPEIKVESISETITYDNAFELLRGYDAVVDGTDNFPARYSINDAAMFNKTPLFHAAVLQYEGRALSVIPKKSACFRCVFPEVPPVGVIPTCREAGVLGATIGVIASVQALETIKYLAGLEVGLKNKLLIFDARSISFIGLEVERNKKCTACGEKFVPSPVIQVCGVEA